MSHPPWLRFQAYVIGLPKTGTTSIARIFSAYRSGHELGTRDLLAAAVPWRLGEIDEHAFWRLSTPRLTRPVLELDAATSTQACSCNGTQGRCSSILLDTSEGGSRPCWECCSDTGSPGVCVTLR